MTMRKALLTVLCIVTLPLASCNLENDNVIFHFVPLQIVSAELPESFTLNQAYQIRVTYIKPNNCTFFDGFEISEPDTTVRNVVAIGSEFEQQQCAEVIEEVETTFSFTVLYSEDYLFRFWTGENADGEQQYLEIEVPVVNQQ